MDATTPEHLQVQALAEQVRELRDLLGDDVGPFPDGAIDSFLSHFLFAVRFRTGDLAGQLIVLTMEPSVQTVSRSRPFVYKGHGGRHRAVLPLPDGSTLPRVIGEEDFLTTPEEYFREGKETVWMQILDLDAWSETKIGPVRIILGETLKREYPDLFQPSYGVAQSLGRSGFPARLFFNPVAVVETPVGAFRAIHGTLVYGRIVSFPPVGTPVTLRQMNPLDSVEELRSATKEARRSGPPAADLVALIHPIDCALHMYPHDAVRAVEARIMQQAKVVP